MTQNNASSANPIQAITASDLMSNLIPPPRFPIAGLLCEGVSILCGTPKTGKSWLALWLCLQVARGQHVWDMPTEQCDVLYLCLEDSHGRIQRRLLSVTEDFPDNLHFAILADDIDEGFTEQIRGFKHAYPGTGLIVVDTLQRIRGNSTDTTYANDYKDLVQIKQLADELCLSILLIHHLRKQRDDDPFAMISGTTGITGAVDTSLVLELDKRRRDKAKLYCTGRDIDYRVLELRFDSTQCLWNLESDSLTQPEIALDEVKLSLVQFMRENLVFCGTPTELAEKLQPYCTQQLESRSISKKLFYDADAFLPFGIVCEQKRSNGSRIIKITYYPDSDDGADSADSDDAEVGAGHRMPVDPAEHNEICRAASDIFVPLPDISTRSTVAATATLCPPVCRDQQDSGIRVPKRDRSAYRAFVRAFDDCDTFDACCDLLD